MDTVKRIIYYRVTTIGGMTELKRALKSTSGMIRSPAKTRTQASEAYDRLRADILSGAIPDGSRLKTRDLCARYLTGLSGIREALNRLSREGFVRQEDLKGFSVQPLSRDDLLELTRARCWLNEIALRESIKLGGAAWEEGALLAFHRMSKIVRFNENNSNSVNPDWERAHRIFHSALINACPSRWILDFCEQLFDVANRYRSLSRTQGSTRKDDHKDILEATLARNADEAVRLLTAHFEMTASLGLAELESRKPG
jgi:GntR family carbon starvation induced transcriptional regulator